MDQIDSASSAIGMGSMECTDALSVELSTSAYMSDAYSTPSHSRCIPFCDSSCTPECDEDKKPAKGMMFSTLDAAEEFYRLYALAVGFDVRTGQSRKVAGVVVWKRLYCSKEGERSSGKEQGKRITDIGKHERNTRIVRCGCEARVTVKCTNDKRYTYSEFFETHTHALVTPSKKMFMKANRKVSDRAKNALLSCHKASIGTKKLCDIRIHEQQEQLGGFFVMILPAGAAGRVSVL